MPEWRFYRHMPVYFSNGRRLGRTEEIAHAVDVIHMQQGRVLIRDWYVPIAAVQDVTPQGVTLNVGPRELRTSGWNVPTNDYLARQGATPGYEYTILADVPQRGDQDVNREGT